MRSITRAGTSRRFRRAASPIPPCPPPTIRHQGCSVRPNPAACASRSSSQLRRPGCTPCSTPRGRVWPCFSSCPRNSASVVSRVQPRPSFRRRWPRPRPTAVSKTSQASTTPSLSEAGPSSRQPAGRTPARTELSIAAISSRPSSVRMFQVKATRSRQKHSSPKSATTAATSPAASAGSKRASHAWACSVAAVESMGFLLCGAGGRTAARKRRR